MPCSLSHSNKNGLIVMDKQNQNHASGKRPFKAYMTQDELLVDISCSLVLNLDLMADYIYWSSSHNPKFRVYIQVLVYNRKYIKFALKIELTNCSQTT